MQLWWNSGRFVNDWNLGTRIEREELAWEAKDLGSNLSCTLDSSALSKSLPLSGPQFPFLHSLLPSQQMPLSSFTEQALPISEPLLLLLSPLDMTFPLISTWQARHPSRLCSNGIFSRRPSGSPRDSSLGALLVATQMFIIKPASTVIASLKLSQPQGLICHWLISDSFHPGPTLSSLNIEHVMNWLEK